MKSSTPSKHQNILLVIDSGFKLKLSGGFWSIFISHSQRARIRHINMSSLSFERSAIMESSRKRGLSTIPL